MKLWVNGIEAQFEEVAGGVRPVGKEVDGELVPLDLEGNVIPPLPEYDEGGEKQKQYRFYVEYEIWSRRDDLL